MAGREPTPGRDERPLANEDELDPADEVILEGMAEDAVLDPEDRIGGTLADDDDIYMDVTAGRAGGDAPEGSGDNETIDGLNELEEAVRQQAEDRALGDDEGFET